jgi:alkylation response protein AidB-like acyl-CoA dehydrogenase
MAGALDLAVEHAKTRVQFGVPIGRFQAVQHLLADAHVDVEGARSLVNHAAWALDHLDLTAAVTAAHVAKAYCSEKGKLVCERSIQVHGGMGMTWECRAHLHHRRAMADRTLLGDEALHYRAIATGASVHG